MYWTSIHPATGAVLHSYTPYPADQLEAVLAGAAHATEDWSNTPVAERARLLRNAARILRDDSEAHARTTTLEMGKLLREARAEIAKCAWTCDYYADHGAAWLVDETVATDATRSYVTYAPLGTILAIMPWNFPYWQVFRAAAPLLLAGNTVLLKHAPMVTGCALAVEKIFHAAGFPEPVFRTLVVPVEQVPALLADPRIHGVTFTGSVRAGREVARHAGANLKKSVLELGGSDPFIVLEDAPLEWTVAQAAASRFANAGQSCVSAKRFIVVDAIAEAFLQHFRTAAAALIPGDPFDANTTLAPLARADLSATLQQQVIASISAGAVPLLGCQPLEQPGNYYPPSILDQVAPGMPAFDEELFGPVAAIIRARDTADAIRLANRSSYGLGGSVWSADPERGEHVARQLQCGMSFVNSIVKSDPRLPCGGIKDSGYGRELSYFGIREFTNAKVVWIR